MSSPPYTSITRETQRSRLSGFFTSQRTAIASPPRRTISSQVRSSFRTVRPAAATFAPSPASAYAMPCPTP
jgi:hypothetical protein